MAAPEPTNRYKIAIKGFVFLHEIKQIIRTGLSTANNDAWPRSEELFRTASQSLSQLYCKHNAHASPISKACLAELEGLLEKLSFLPTHKLNRNSRSVINCTNATLIKIKNISTSDPVSANDKQILEQSIQFTLFIRAVFLPTAIIYHPRTTWLDKTEEKVIEFVKENRIVCVAATLTIAVTAYWLWNKKNDSESSHPAGWEERYTAGMDSRMKKRLVANGTQFHISGKECAVQEGLDCGYHTAMNELHIIQALEARRARKFFNRQLTTAEIHETIATLELPAATTVRAEKQGYLDYLKEKNQTLQGILLSLEGKTDQKSLQKKRAAQANLRLTETELNEHDGAASLTQETIERFTAYELTQGRYKGLKSRTMRSASGTSEVQLIHSDDEVQGYFSLNHDHIANSGEQEDLAELTTTLRKMTPRNVQILQSDLQTSMTDDGSIDFDRPLKHKVLSPGELHLLPRAKDFQERSPHLSNYLKSIKAFQAGKTIICGWLDHSGDLGGTGHWTTSLITPNEARPPTHAHVIKIDSLNPAGTNPHASGMLKSYLHDLLTLHLISPDKAKEIRGWLKPARILAAPTVA